MTTGADATLDTPPGAVPRRNWGAVVIAITGAALVVASVLNGISRSIVDFPTDWFGPISGVMLTLFVLAPIALIVGFTPLAFGANGLVSLVGPSIRGRLWLFATPLVATVAEFTAAGLLLGQLGSEDPTAIVRAENGALVAVIFALLVALIAGVLVARARVAIGTARFALIVTVVLVAITLIGGIVSNDSNWVLVPFSVGILLLGTSYWRSGLGVRGPIDSGVTEMPKSLAE